MLNLPSLDHLTPDQKDCFWQTFQKQQKQKSMVVFLWLFSIVGICGVYYYYINKPLKATVYLVTFGYLGIGCAIDGFTLWKQLDKVNQDIAQAILKDLPSQPASQQQTQQLNSPVNSGI